MSQIIGHEKILAYLKQQLQEESLTHAYLFTGPQHVGKTKTAQWFAASLLCHGSQPTSLFGASVTEKPCKQCPSCQSLQKSLHPDLHSLQVQEEEHSISIESMRLFLKGLSTSPSLGPRKVAVLNDAHALTPGAANAFLKTLEESSASTTILVVTHQPHKLLPTILSRCQIIEFQRVTQAGENIAQDAFWQAARGLPGKYIAYKEAGENPDDKEKAFFLGLLKQSPGERFLALEPLFKKTPGHGEKRLEWKQRLHLWQLALQDLMHDSLEQRQTRATPRQCQVWLDQIHHLREASSAPINIRAHVEGFLAAIPRL